MKLSIIIKYCTYFYLSIFLFFLSLYLFVEKIYANAPDIAGGVITQTGAGIPGVTVVWVDNRGASRSTTTDGNGRFFFVSWQNSGNGSGFGCMESPHTWYVSNVSSCSPISASFSNTGGYLDIGVIPCGPPPPPPTPIPTSTPVPTPTPPIPCSRGTTCVPESPYCKIDASGQGICGPYPTLSQKSPKTNSVKPTDEPYSYPTPTLPAQIPFLDLILGGIR